MCHLLKFLPALELHPHPYPYPEKRLPQLISSWTSGQLPPYPYCSFFCGEARFSLGQVSLLQHNLKGKTKSLCGFVSWTTGSKDWHSYTASTQGLMLDLNSLLSFASGSPVVGGATNSPFNSTSWSPFSWLDYNYTSNSKGRCTFGLPGPPVQKGTRNPDQRWW